MFITYDCLVFNAAKGQDAPFQSPHGATDLSTAEFYNTNTTAVDSNGDTSESDA
jgi:hypothetical protein